jgi:hypothetical protein
MITKVEVRTPVGTLLTLQLDDVSDGFVVEDIQGLDPVKATLVSSSFANLDGAQYQSARREFRNIVMVIGLEPDYITTSVRDLRTHLYNFFLPKSQVELRFYMSDGLIVNISGRVESFETQLFTREPTVNISIVCFDPDFTETAPVSISGSSVSDSSEFLVTYDGTIETGILFTLNVDRVLGEFTIYHRPPDGVVRTLDFSASLVADDVVVIDTVVGEKSATLTRTSTLSSLLYAVSPQSNWFQLQPGDNYLRVYAVGSAIPFSIEYTTRHGGL